MGWKLLKETFKVSHFVHMSADKQFVLIGSPYINDLATINVVTGAIENNKVSPGFLKEYYPLIQAADPLDLIRLIAAPDVFAKSIPVYTEKDGEIVEKFCEEPDWPHVTHDGTLMYANTFSTDKSVAVARGKRSCTIAIGWEDESIASLEKEINNRKRRKGEYEAQLAKLNADYPEISQEADGER